MDLFKTDSELEYQPNRPATTWSAVGIVVGVSILTAVAALPFGDASGGTNFLFAPPAAGAIAWILLSWRRNLHAAGLAFLTAIATLVLMGAAVMIVLSLFGI